MKIAVKRRLFSRLLLSIYLMVLAASVLHVHEHVESAFVCRDCVTHTHHGGHISAGSVASCDCVICDFLATSYVFAQALTLPAVALVACTLVVERQQKCVCCTCRVPGTRAPPCL